MDYGENHSRQHSPHLNGISNENAVQSATGSNALHLHNVLPTQPVSPGQQDKSPGSVCSNLSSSTTSTSTSSAPQYSEDVRRALPALDLLPRQGSGSSTKTCEVDVGDEERDTFSPISSSNGTSPSEVTDSPAAVSDTAELAHANNICNGGNAKTNATLDNKDYDGQLPSTPLKHKLSCGLGGSGGSCSNMHSTSKEEKQRQNEEIVIMETSSISSEAGSWESVFPHTSTSAAAAAQINMSQKQPATGSMASATNILDRDFRNCCEEFLQSEDNAEHERKTEKPKDHFKYEALANEADAQPRLKEVSSVPPYLRERTYSTGAPVTADTSSLFAGGSTSSLLRDLDKRERALSTSGTSACFIDASSLRDEDEVLSFPSLDGHHSNDEHESNEKDDKGNPDDEIFNEHELNASKEEEESPTKQLETFHRSFAKCKTKSKESPTSMPKKSNSSSSSQSGADSPKKGTSVGSASSANNLSDEEKLWKREHDSQKNSGNSEFKRSFEKDGHPHALSALEDATEASVSLAGDVDSSDSSEVVKLRREQERKHGGFGFQHNMQHFTIHPLSISPKFSAISHTHPTGNMAPHGTHTGHSDLSYTTDYSSSSPAPSLVWSEHEVRPGTAGNAGRQHADDYDNHIPRTGALPDTPHNSIVHVEVASSNTSSIHRDYTLSSSFSHQRDSGAYCSDATDSPIPMPRTPKRSKFDEANPIISGGSSFKDFQKQCASPPVKRRTDTCPIVSGGFASLDFERTQPLDDDGEEEVELRAKPKTRKPIPAITSWVVDMSDCKPERRKSSSSSSSLEAVPQKFRERSDSTGSHKSGCGFYVPLTEEDSTAMPLKPHMSKSFTAPKSAGFFVNLSKSEYQPKENSPPDDTNESVDKKNLFSMFIDIGEKKPLATIKKEPPSLSARLSQRQRPEDSMRSSASSTETLMSKSTNLRAPQEVEAGESKSLDYKCNTTEALPITVAAIRRISQQQRTESEVTKRHSWGNNPNQCKELNTPHDYKRSISLTANGEGKEGGGNGLMSIIDKLPLISKTSSMSIDSSVSPYDDLVGSKSELSSLSNNSARNSMSGGERDDDGQQINNASGGGTKVKKRRRDVQINETFDKSSVASITDGILSKDLSPASTTETDDLTFQQDEELAIRESPLLQQQFMSQSNSNRSSAIVMETIIETKETSSPKKSAESHHTMESLHATIEKQKMLLETVNEHIEAEKSSFVKLSDMDKPVKIDFLPTETMSKSVGNHRQINRLYRDESKGRPHSWTMTRSTGNALHNITNSVDNLRSLSRLFPNFTKEFSNSLPNDMILDQMDYIQTDISNDSSLASSFSRSGMDESSISCRQPRRLGEDLLKMFLQEIATDMIVEVHGRRIKAHKCILRSRCQYFAAMLAGSGAQSVVSLQGYSYSAVHFALCHIYSGASHPPDGISLMELAALADLLGLEGLKEVTAHALKTNYCHNFHKPCSGCIDGILQVLPVALNHALDDLYRKCLRWTCRHYLKVWPTRQFAQLPADILGRCRQQIVAYLTSESVLDTVIDCDHLLVQLAAFRWGGVCDNLVRDILEAAYGYIADHFASLIASDSFLSLGHDRSCHIPRLQGVLLRTASTLTPDQACRSYQRVTRLNTVLQAKVIQMPANLADLAKELQGLQDEDLEWDPEYIRLISAILSAVEQCLIRQCSRAMRVTAWQRMDLDLRKKIQTLAQLTEPLEAKRIGKPTGKSYSFGGNSRNHDLYQVKLAIQAHSKRTLAQDTQLYKATQTQEVGNVQTAERGVQANDVREGTGKILKSNSRAYVPQKAGSLATGSNTDRSITTIYRRTQSEAPKPVAPLPEKNVEQQKATPSKQKPTARLTDVRPRYLEPRKSRGVGSNGCGPVRSATSSSIPATRAKGHQISSSDSSRTSSPAARRVLSTKIGTKSKNMSLDSLASPRHNKATRAKFSDNDRYSDVCADSLADSMKSSVITNKTISQESLSNNNKLSRSNPVITSKSVSLKQMSGSKPTSGNSSSSIKLTKPAALALGHKSARQLQRHNMTSAGSSPSSITTTKSAASRLSSVSSTHSSRDLFKHRSISVPGSNGTIAAPPTEAAQRHSFLSAKSREILAKRAEKNKQLQQQQEQEQTAANCNDVLKPTKTTGPLRSVSHAAATNVRTASVTANNRNSLPSNIPTRRPNTLQLKKTNDLNKHNSNAPNSTAVAPASNKHRISHATNGVLKAAQAVKQRIELLIDTSVATVTVAPLNGESKLERSSTFCKESCDIDLNELQIIE